VELYPVPRSSPNRPQPWAVIGISRQEYYARCARGEIRSTKTPNGRVLVDDDEIIRHSHNIERALETRLVSLRWSREKFLRTTEIVEAA
jgi:hypothetical protein